MSAPTPPAIARTSDDDARAHARDTIEGIEPLLDADQVAEILQVGKRFVWRLAREGALPRIVVGDRYIRFDPGDVRDFIEARRQRPDGTAAVLTAPTQRRRKPETRRRF